jgi:tetratricopeptide (TPR) repeat protein
LRADAIRLMLARAGETAVVEDRNSARWPFTRTPWVELPQTDVVVWARRLHDAFPGGQAGGTRLVLTQSSYQMQRWLDWISSRGTVRLIADADRAALEHTAPEALTRRGPWAHFDIVDVGEPGTEEPHEPGAPIQGIGAAFRTTDPEERLTLCRRAVDDSPADPIVLLALGSGYMEVQDLEASREAIERAIALAPDWEAVHYEHGKLFLRLDDMERASRAFAEAGRLMPSFSAAFSNLGATLGELDRPDEALRAFEQALADDPNGYTILNNIGVVSRELGRLPASEAALRKVVSIAPDFVFGHYNLGHTLFLQGRYQAALAAYIEGQRRDPEKNARQACRLAVVRLAAGDAEGAVRDLQRHTARLPTEQKREVLAEAQEILWALLTDQPALAGWRRVADAVQKELVG